MPPKRIDEWEVDRYWEIFASLLEPGSSHLNGSQAASVLKNSRLRDDQLERIWDLSDVDNDGQLDFEEFCVAMRLVFDLVNGESNEVPASLPDWMVPESKAHLVQAGRAVASGHQRASALDEDDDDDGSGLKDGFDWYMSPAQRSEYDDIYSSAKDGHGYVTFNDLSQLFDSLDVPDTDVRSAWNLVNPSADTAIGKDAALAFLHVLRGRHDGFRLPKTVPPSLRASFEHRNVEYNVDRVKNSAGRNMGDDSTTTGRKSKFGDAYLSRLGGSSARGSSGAPRGTDFGTAATTSDWEEVRLKKQLKELEAKISRVEEAARKREERGRRSESKPALVKRELEQLLDWKRRELRDLEMGEGKAKEGQDLKRIRGEIEDVKGQVEGLEQHLKKREAVLEGLKAEVRDERGR
ncbi:MAG: endocytosis defective- protein [Alyxoria varia]|nr:MAG: endocytosis defective- protein [Alyxoria varia]